MHSKIVGLGIPILIAKEELLEKLNEIGYGENFDIEIINSTNGDLEKIYRIFI